jgi:hypothetical protein
MKKFKLKQKLAFILMILALNAIQNASAQKLVVSDPLISAELLKGEINKKNLGGQFTEKGWQALKQGDYLMIELSDEAGFEGSLEVDIQNLCEQFAGNKNGAAKVHFLNMFSNPISDHHAEDGGTDTDALWTLRTGNDEEGKPRYGQNFKILWASKGAKRTEGSDYHEKIVRLADDWKWDKKTYTFGVSWSQKEKSIKVFIDRNLVFSGQWTNQVSPLRYIWLAKSPDFQSLVGPVFSNLKISKTN